MTSRTSFKIVEQDTGMSGCVQQPLYSNNSIYICQRFSPEFTMCGDNGVPTLYLQGGSKRCDNDVVDCGSFIFIVLCTLKKVFDEFKVLNCNKFILEK